MKVLLSIKPEYAERILDGSKRYEFRRKIYQNEKVENIVIYATLPVGKVIGEFSVKQVHQGCPKHLWRKTRKFAGISKKFFSEYFLHREIGYAIEVIDPVRYEEPKDLQVFLPHGVAPQSFAYIKNNTWLGDQKQPGVRKIPIKCRQSLPAALQKSTNRPSDAITRARSLAEQKAFDLSFQP